MGRNKSKNKFRTDSQFSDYTILNWAIYSLKIKLYICNEPNSYPNISLQITAIKRKVLSRNSPLKGVSKKEMIPSF